MEKEGMKKLKYVTPVARIMEFEPCGVLASSAGPGGWSVDGDGGSTGASTGGWSNDGGGGSTGASTGGWSNDGGNGGSTGASTGGWSND